MSIQDDIFDIQAKLKDSESEQAFNRVIKWAGQLEIENDTYHKCDRLRGRVSIFSIELIDDDGVHAVLNYRGGFKAALLTKDDHLLIKWLGKKCTNYVNSARHAH